MNYKCKICGKNHEVYFGISAGASQTLHTIMEENPSRVTEAENNMFLLDGTTMVFPGVIIISTSFEHDFFYETWVECEIQDFIDMTEKMSKQGTASLNGKLYDNLYPYFPHAKGKKCNIEFNLDGSVDDKAKITITEDCQLRDYQTQGVTQVQVESLMNKLHHAKPMKQ